MLATTTAALLLLPAQVVSIVILEHRSEVHLCRGIFNVVNPSSSQLYLHPPGQAPFGVLNLVQNAFYSRVLKGEEGFLSSSFGCNVNKVASTANPSTFLIAGGTRTTVPPTDILEPASYIGNAPVYVQNTLMWGSDAYIVFGGWVDAAANVKVCEWSATSNDLALIAEIEAGVHCG